MKAKGQSRVPVRMESATSFKGQYLRHMRTDEIFYCTDAGREGITVYQAEGFGGAWGGDEILITWRAIQPLYAIMVHVADIDTKPGQVH